MLNPFMEIKEIDTRAARWPLRFSANAGDAVDQEVVSYRLYNSFNLSTLLPAEMRGMKVSLGVTGLSRRVGKTTVACNLAAALSLSSGRNTVLVDFNVTHPNVHSVFGTLRGPGITDALVEEEVCVIPTQIDNLFVLPVGSSLILPPSRYPAFREVLMCLYSTFDFVVVDMPSFGARSFPALVANQLSGLVAVVQPHRTRRREISQLLRRLGQETVIGFVMNRVHSNDF